jgi:2-phosphosulfolactate phosphatase
VKLDVAFTPAEVDTTRLEGRTVVVLDVLRATSTIVEALSNGATAVIPVETVEAALATASTLEDDVIVCGERGGLPAEGFDLGNSPLEFDAESVEGRTLVMSTSNGTHALLTAEPAGEVLVGSLLNASAVAAAAAERDDVLLLCAGRQGRFALEDSVCAGLIGRRLAETTSVTPTDSARAALVLAGRYDESPDGFLRHTAAAESLRGVGLLEDVAFCEVLDRHDVVPRMRDRRITL